LRCSHRDACCLHDELCNSRVDNLAGPDPEEAAVVGLIASVPA
jgi:hypothetical protein